jgi:glycosylphosphatidylinositol deacylase
MNAEVKRWLFPLALGQADVHCKAPVPSVSETLSLFVRRILSRLLGVSFVVSLLPLPRDYILGNSGEVFFALLTPLILLLVTGLVIVSWWAICMVMFLIRILARNLAR